MNSKKIKKEKLKLDKNNELNRVIENNDMSVNEIVTLKKGKKKAAVNFSENNIDNTVLQNNELQGPAKKKKKVSANNNEDDIENVGEPVKPKKKKSKQILEEIHDDKTLEPNKKRAKKKLGESVTTSETNKQTENGISFDEGEKHVKESLSDIEDLENIYIKPDNKDNSLEKKKEEIMWSNEDLMELVANMEKLIPKNDSLAFSTRTEKLEWDKVIFKNYTVDECKKTWSLLSKKIRKYRLLKEVLNDARDLIVNPPNQKKKHKPTHPDMPKRPLSSYLLFYLKQKDRIIAENPGIELTEITKKIGMVYKNLPPEEKSIYDKMAARAKEEYEEKMKEFYLNHPEFKIKPVPPPKPPKPLKERVPKRPPTPFGFYYQSELKKDNIPDNEKNQFKEICKDRWKQLSDKKKLFWITWAEEQQVAYENELKNYISSHPDYVVNHGTKLVLTKEEKSIKERVAGKPVKPPHSAYALFARTVLQSEDVKNIPTKERLNFVSNQWKTCSDDEKKHYKDLQTSMMDQYKVDFAHYLETLPEDQRNLEIQKNAPKRRKSDDHGDSSRKKKRKTEEKTDLVVEQKPKFQEPEQPPISAFKYFTKSYTGQEPPVQAWKKLSQEEKEKYEQELIKKKHEYIAAFEKFLKSLTKEELEAFSNSRNQAKQQNAEASDDEEDEEDEEEEDESEDNNDSSDSDSDSDSDDE